MQERHRYNVTVRDGDERPLQALEVDAASAVIAAARAVSSVWGKHAFLKPAEFNGKARVEVDEDADELEAWGHVYEPIAGGGYQANQLSGFVGVLVERAR